MRFSCAWDWTLGCVRGRGWIGSVRAVGYRDTTDVLVCLFWNVAGHAWLRPDVREDCIVDRAGVLHHDELSRSGIEKTHVYLERASQKRLL